MSGAWTDADFDEMAKEALVVSRDRDLEKRDDLIALLFAAQLAFVNDPAQRKTLRCPRDCGKTFACVVYLYAVALTYPQGVCAFIAVTREQARKIIWQTLLDFNKRFDLGGKPNETRLTMTMPNGSIIEVGGCETKGDIEYYRGRSYRLVIIDEAKSFPPLLIDELVQEGIEPRLHGVLVLSGTPGYVKKGLFYATTHQIDSLVVTEKRGKRTVMSRPFADRDSATWSEFREVWTNVHADTTFTWSSHSWTAEDNTALPGLADEHEAKRIANGWAETNPKWLREYKALWATDEGEYCVHYDDERNGWTPGDLNDGGGSFDRLKNPLGLPCGEGRYWRFGLGSDLGHDDKFTIQVFAWANDITEFYQVYEDEIGQGHPSLWADAYRKALKAVGGEITFWMVDRGGLGKAIVQEFAVVHGIFMEPADKQQKTAHIRIWDGELIDGRCKIMRGSALERQCLTVAWEDPKEKKEVVCGEDGDDHFHAALYIITKLQHHFAELGGPKPPEPGSPEWDQAREKALADWIDKKRERRETLDTAGADEIIDVDPIW